MPDSRSLTTREVARLCHVSDATVKRWEDDGLLKSERTSGGHRRFRAEEIARFQRRQGLGIKRCHGDASILTATARRRDLKLLSGSPIFHTLLGGCEEEAANLLIGEYLQGKALAEIFDDFVCPAMRQIGELWSSGELTVTEEHLATRAACNAVHKLRNVLPVPETSGGRLAMCCAVEDDFHELPTFLVQIVMENEGWEVANFGANTPLYCLAEEILQYQPKMICISATIIDDIERFSRDFKNFIEQTERLGISIALGGRALSDNQTRRRFAAGHFVETFADLARFARDLKN
ncbi:MAG TPA: B12-binding domain-containing protein [Pyrinomonadaceae bacterium]|jgi:excisionase family DNA binding protein